MSNHDAERAEYAADTTGERAPDELTEREIQVPPMSLCGDSTIASL